LQQQKQKHGQERSTTNGKDNPACNRNKQSRERSTNTSTMLLATETNSQVKINQYLPP
jgi:hypothetical protein